MSAHVHAGLREPGQQKSVPEHIRPTAREQHCHGGGQPLCSEQRCPGAARASASARAHARARAPAQAAAQGASAHTAVCEAAGQRPQPQCAAPSWWRIQCDAGLMAVSATSIIHTALLLGCARLRTRMLPARRELGAPASTPPSVNRPEGTASMDNPRQGQVPSVTLR